MKRSTVIGIAGWSIPPKHRNSADAASHLEGYARRFRAVEINSSFHRPHRRATYERWARSVPNEFRFSVKVPKLLTHELRLQRCRAPAARFLDEVQGLEEKLSTLLVQLPPSLEFERRPARNFFALLRAGTAAHIVCEPRHPSWFEPRVGEALERWQVSRAAADPSPAAAASTPGGDLAVVYYRLHGSPRMYYSAYDSRSLHLLCANMREHAAAGRCVWCIFDNTAAYAAWDNAVDLQRLHRDAAPIGERSSRGAGSSSTSSDPAPHRDPGTARCAPARSAPSCCVGQPTNEIAPARSAVRCPLPRSRPHKSSQ